MTAASDPPYAIEGSDAPSRFVIVCDHASNRFPAPWGELGLGEAERRDHIAWDPGALPVSRSLAARLGAPVFRGTISRLVLDVNRPEESPTLIPETSDSTAIPGNRALSADERARRIANVHAPYHAALAALLDRRVAAAAPDAPPALIAVHSFTPVFKGTRRDFDIGILFGADDRLAAPMLTALAGDIRIDVRANEPYSPADGVYYTLDRHGTARGLETVMIEIRNDLIAGPAEADAWAGRLARALSGAG
ncbi:N-formylglutamate amidohydrolase [Methylobrevis albus]|uniref:N-formylglutamate amidohydrolase n=1 Tax=Methylobrevis albus TaxID=2793297 RepID=A0A931HZN6_9HYPH|nr:N-formylglutamate amidohydrolase [Methylobrevis albus]MBH0236645.1 N-formylglutamate amidohydrolase [Methylobrevis albus]